VRILFVLFIVMPILEMLILIKVGSLIGAWYTIGLVLLTAIIGVNLLKKQGLSTLMRAQQKAQYGELPVSEIGEGLLLAVAGALLLTPGFVTDAVGFALLSPAVRRELAKGLAKRMVVTGQANYQTNYQAYGDAQAQYRKTHVESENGNVVIDAEYVEIKNKPSDS
jgi:UPF0716 protein FxsA